MFKEVSTKLHFPKIEEEILEFWQAEEYGNLLNYGVIIKHKNVSFRN